MLKPAKAMLCSSLPARAGSQAYLSHYCSFGSAFLHPVNDLKQDCSLLPRKPPEASTGKVRAGASPVQ